MAFLYVSGLAPEVKEQEVIQYLENQGLKPVGCQKIKTKKEKYRSSFKLSIHHEDREKYLTPVVWPKNVMVNHFLNLQRPMVTS